MEAMDGAWLDILTGHQVEPVKGVLTTYNGLLCKAARSRYRSSNFFRR